MRPTHLACLLVGLIGLAEVDQVNAQVKKKLNNVQKKKVILSGPHVVVLTADQGKVHKLRLVKQKGVDVLEVQREDLLAIPIEFLVTEPGQPKTQFASPDERANEDAQSIKAMLDMVSGQLDLLADQPVGAYGTLAILKDFAEHTHCLNPDTDKEVPFQEYLTTYIEKHDYVAKGYISDKHLQQEIGLLLYRVLLFDKWMLLEAKMIRDQQGQLHSLIDCQKGELKSQNSDAAVKAMQNVLRVHRDTKELQKIREGAKIEFVLGTDLKQRNIDFHFKALAWCTLTCMLTVEANRVDLEKTPEGRMALERLRLTLLHSKLPIHFPTIPLKVIVVDKFSKT